MCETRGSADSGETGRGRTNAFWDNWDEKERSARLGSFGRKRESLHFFTLGHLGQKVSKYAVRVNWPKMKQKAHLNLRNLRQKVLEYATRPVRVKLEQSALLKLG
ncbi:hypothetical protein KI387_035279, partial [Taxus chinensis]